MSADCPQLLQSPEPRANHARPCVYETEIDTYSIENESQVLECLELYCRVVVDFITLIEYMSGFFIYPELLITACEIEYVYS